MVDKKLSEFSQITPDEIAKLICLYLDENNAIKNGVVDFATLNNLIVHKDGTETITGDKTFSGDAVFSGNATFNNTVNANVSGSSGSCTGNSATATKATQDASGNNIGDTYATKTELAGKVDLNAANLSTAGKSLISGLGMPSSRYIDLTVGASGTQYTAPANGWVSVHASSTGVPGTYIEFVSDSSLEFGTAQQAAFSGVMRLCMPVQKNSTYRLWYNGPHFEQFRFYYAQGEQ